MLMIKNIQDLIDKFEIKYDGKVYHIKEEMIKDILQAILDILEKVSDGNEWRKLQRVKKTIRNT